MIETFQELNCAPEIKRALDEMGFSEPTPIQKEVLPLMLEGRDCVAQAPTGTGKTCAFGIPLVERVDPEDESVQALVLCPTRELAVQITEELRGIARYSEGVRILTVYGGQPIQKQLSALRKRPQILVGTPGRVIDHLERRSVRLGALRTLVLDEADEMLNMGFREDIDKILAGAPEERQTVLFSATMSPEILRISREYQRDPVTLRVKAQESALPRISQYCVKVREKDKLRILMKLLDDNAFSLSLVFCNTKKRAQELSEALCGYGYRAESLHGDLNQRERDAVMKKYRSGGLGILVATDVAARGIDVDGIEAVFNFDVPNDPEYYVHRIGRTARANREGISYTLATARQLGDTEAFERYTGVKMERVAVSAGSREVDEKKFSLALDKLEADNDVYRSFLYRKLDELNRTGGRQYDFADLAAALLAKLCEGEAEPSELTEDNSAARKETGERRPRSAARRSANTSERRAEGVGSRPKKRKSPSQVRRSQSKDKYAGFQKNSGREE